MKLQLGQLDKRLNRVTDAYIDRLIDKDIFEQRKTALLAALDHGREIAGNEYAMLATKEGKFVAVMPDGSVKAFENVKLLVQPLNSLGANGWEFCGTAENGFSFVLKRPYCRDEERTVCFSLAREFGNRLRAIYERLGYSLIDIPCASVEERANYILRHLGVLQYPTARQERPRAPRIDPDA